MDKEIWWAMAYYTRYREISCKGKRCENIYLLGKNTVFSKKYL